MAFRTKRKKNSNDFHQYDPKLSRDKRTFTMKVMSTAAETYFTFLNSIRSFCNEEMERIGEVKSETFH